MERIIFSISFASIILGTGYPGLPSLSALETKVGISSSLMKSNFSGIFITLFILLMSSMNAFPFSSTVMPSLVMPTISASLASFGYAAFPYHSKTYGRITALASP